MSVDHPSVSPMDHVLDGERREHVPAQRYVVRGRLVQSVGLQGLLGEDVFSERQGTTRSEPDRSSEGRTYSREKGRRREQKSARQDAEGEVEEDCPVPAVRQVKHVQQGF